MTIPKMTLRRNRRPSSGSCRRPVANRVVWPGCPKGAAAASGLRTGRASCVSDRRAGSGSWSASRTSRSRAGSPSSHGASTARGSATSSRAPGWCLPGGAARRCASRRRTTRSPRRSGRRTANVSGSSPTDRIRPGTTRLRRHGRSRRPARGRPARSPISTGTRSAPRGPSRVEVIFTGTSRAHRAVAQRRPVRRRRGHWHGPASGPRRHRLVQRHGVVRARPAHR